MQLLRSIEEFSEAVWPYVFHATWQSILAGVLILAIVWLLRNRSASLRYALLVLALAKFAVPPLMAVSIDFPHWTPAEVPVRTTLASLSKDPSQVPSIDPDTIPVAEPRVSVRATASHEAPPQQPVTAQSAPIEPAIPVTPRHQLVWHTKLLALHVTGAFVACLWILGWMLRIWKLKRRASMVTAGPLYERFMSLCAALDLIFISGDKTSPIAFGLFRPKVLMPASMVEELSAEQLGGILAHELAHVRRRDLWVIALENLLLLLWWFNPVFWMVARALRRTREDCCDDLVLHLELAENSAYCESLVRAASSIADFGRLRPAVGAAEMLHPLGRRMKRVMDLTVGRSPKLSIVGMAFILVLGVTVLPGLRLVAVAGDEVGENRIGSETRVPEEFAYLVPRIDTGPYRLYGTVLDQEGRAAAGIKVAAFRGEAWQWGYKNTTTGEDGAYEITGLPDGAYHLSAVSAKALDVRPISLGSYFQKGEDLRQDLTLRPFDPDPLEGIVISKSGEPVPGALILSLAGWGSYGMGLALQVRTDEAGRFLIPRWTWRPGTESRLLLHPTLAAFAEGHEPGMLRGELPEGEPVTLVLDDGVRVSGTVRFKESGQPAPDIPVKLRRAHGSSAVPDIDTRTDTSGNFVFEPLCPLGYELVIYDPGAGYTSTEQPRIELGKGEDVPGLEMQISSGATIGGKVTYEETGEPIPGVHLWIPNPRPPRTLREAVTGADGTYRLEHLPSGKFAIAYEVPDGVVREFRYSDIGPLVAKEVPVGPDEQLMDVDFTFEHGASVSGRVMDEAGDPVEGVRLSATNFHHGQRPSRHLVTSEVKTAADGTYRLCGVAPSDEWTYQLTLSAEGYGRIESDPIRVTNDVGNQNFVVKHCATISGRVVDTQGNPVPTVAVSLKPVEGRASQRLPSAMGDVEGRFTMSEGAYPGTYTFELYTLNMGFGPYRRVEAANAPLEITGPDDITGLELVLPDEEPPPVPAPAEQPAAPQADGKLQIITARYGARDKWVDVTPQLRSQIRGDRLTVQASNNLAGDPIYGVAKVLEVEYRWDDETYSAKVDETRTLTLPTGREREQANASSPDMTSAITAAVQGGETTPAKGVEPIPAPEDILGRLVFHGRYKHKSRGSEYGTSSLWVKEQNNGAISVRSDLTFFNETALCVSDENHRPVHYAASRKASSRYPAFEARLEFGEEKTTQIRHWGDETDDKEYPIDHGALFALNSRPDPYAAMNILVRRFGLKAGETKEFLLCDWGNGPAGEGTLPSYRVSVEHRGKENITVPSGTFEANHLVLTQLTSADTWFKKRAGHITDIWVLDNYVIVKILRHREPYEVELLDYDAPDKLPGTVEGLGAQREADDGKTWQRTFGGAGNDYVRSVQQTSDGGYIVGAASPSSSSCLLKLDARGNLVWKKTYMQTTDEGVCVQETEEGGYIVACTCPLANGGASIGLTQVSAIGDVIWEKTLDTTGFASVRAMQISSDGGFVLAGYFNSPGEPKGDMYLAKTDHQGDLLWEQTFGGVEYDAASAVRQTMDEGYILAGQTNSFGAGNGDIYLVRTDAEGNLLWQKAFGAAGLEHAAAVQQTDDGGFVAAGRSTRLGAETSDMYLLKTNKDGNLLWERTFGEDRYEWASAMIQTSDDGFLLAGLTDSFGTGVSDVYAIKTDAEGNKIWEKTYGGSHNERATTLSQARDGGFIVAGWTFSFSQGERDLYIIKTDANGNSPNPPRRLETTNTKKPVVEEERGELALSTGDVAVASSFSAQLVDTERKPFADARVYLHPAIGHPDKRGQDRASMPTRNTVTDAEGKFSFDAVNSGTYTLQLYWKDGGDKGHLYLDAQRFWLDVSPAAANTDLTIVAPSLTSHSVSGYVRDAQGSPVEGVAIDAMGRADYSRSSTTTNSAGHYLIRGIAGNMAETIWFKGAGKAELKNVSVGTTDADVTLR